MSKVGKGPAPESRMDKVPEVKCTIIGKVRCTQKSWTAYDE